MIANVQQSLQLKNAVTAAGIAWALATVHLVAIAAEDVDFPAAPKSQQEVMSARGFVRHLSAWRTVQEIELLERVERTTLAQKQWNIRIDRLRKQLDQPAQSGRAAEEIREIADPYAVPALAAALTKESVLHVRGLYIEALSRIRSSAATAVLIQVAIDHPNPETRLAAVERLEVIGPHQAVPMLVAALGSADNGRINRAAEALGRLGGPSAVAPLIQALETQHLVVVGDDGPEGSTSATFTPSGGGLSMGGGKKNNKVSVKNNRVLEALVLLTGANFEWNASAWRAWLANRQAPPDFDPRRDE